MLRGAAGRGCPVVIFAIAMTIFAWRRGWGPKALIPGIPGTLMGGVFLYTQFTHEGYLFSDSAYLLLLGSGLCVCILGLMAYCARE
ncbi:MAG: hypothetical protein JW941_05175 [Candidatus Coatesbacteria bacterium]|nr:hypothetical protein [Candidatus Coatesbacteria bacterium]